LGYKESPISQEVEDEITVWFTKYCEAETSITRLKEHYSLPFLGEHHNSPTYTYVGQNGSVAEQKVLYGNYSLFNINYGYSSYYQGAEYDSAFWACYVTPPFPEREKFYRELSWKRPVAEQFADFHIRTDSTLHKLKAIYGDDPYLNLSYKKQLKTMKRRYLEFYDPKYDFK
jgi:hypothetical protein